MRCFILLSVLFFAISVRAQEPPPPVAPVDSNRVYSFAQEQPEFPGGMSALIRYLQTEIHYPEQALEDSLQGKVYVEFTVMKDGAIADAKVRRGVHPLLDAEALRAVMAMPHWVPGRLDGRLVKVRFTIPISFTLRTVATGTAPRSTR